MFHGNGFVIVVDMVGMIIVLVWVFHCNACIVDTTTETWNKKVLLHYRTYSMTRNWWWCMSKIHWMWYSTHCFVLVVNLHHRIESLPLGYPRESIGNKSKKICWSWSMIEKKVSPFHRLIVSNVVEQKKMKLAFVGIRHERNEFDSFFYDWISTYARANERKIIKKKS